MTRTRHDPDRELAAQGFANVAASPSVACPAPEPWRQHGQPVQRRTDADFGHCGRCYGPAGGLAARGFCRWIPTATLSGVLIVVGLRMIDTDPLRFLESRSTVLDFSSFWWSSASRYLSD